MKCLIIAAGQGSRLRSLAEAKPLIPLKSIPLIDRVINSALEAGADDFYVVVGYQGASIRAHLEESSKAKNFPLTIIENEDWKKANGVSVLKAEAYLNEPFLLLMGDHIFDPEIARQLIFLSPENKGVILAVDEDLKNQFIDMDDVTRVLAENNQIKSIGKGLDSYNCFDTGIFLCNSKLFSAIKKSSTEFGDDSLSGGIRLLAQEECANVMPINGLFWCDIDDPTNFKQAEDYLSSLPEKCAK